MVKKISYLRLHDIDKSKLKDSRCDIVNTVKIEKDLLEELVDFKLKAITDSINEILEKRKEKSIDIFLKRAKDGTLEEAEEDAIDLTNLIDERARLYDLKKSWSKDFKTGNE
jgi:predicted oxidoreductase